ncbi:hypothetical protein C8J30_10412 [Rhodobacter viridis]|uniref:Uncharacterized protein n=1 Tax=Rhodobacter viridis TaxID=1054202 RepID=A0A318TZ82_9RHOB|nr:hypothetical protein [Rhodobacter viridis]PYF10534.1 hypothetical protein C8J30_10412 [Rhodobacter viridis]
MSAGVTESLWLLARIGLAAQETAQLRLKLWQIEAQARMRLGMGGLVLTVLATLVGTAAIGLGLAATVVQLHLAGWSLSAALALTSGGAAFLSLMILLFADRALRGALGG